MEIELTNCIKYVRYSFERGTGRKAQMLYLGEEEYKALNELVRKSLSLPESVIDPIQERCPEVLEMTVIQVYVGNHMSVA